MVVTMAFFDKVTDKAREIADSAKINVKIAEEKRRIVDLKEQAGILVWSKYCMGEVTDKDIVAICEQIKASYEAIDALNDELINRVRNKQTEPADADPTLDMQDDIKCTQCGATLAKEQNFCGNCGAKAPEPPKNPVCIGCGAELSEDQAFCSSCGLKC